MATLEKAEIITAEPDFHTGFADLDREFSYWVKPIRGKIPDDLKGTLFRIGPGRMTMGDRQYGHWFDGPGMVNAVSFLDGKAHYKNKYVRTPKFVKETKANKILYRGFGTQREGGLLNNLGHIPAQCANTNVMWHAGKLKAYYEGGQPYEIDPYTLDTKGVDYCNGALNSRKFFSAHAKINSTTGHMINFGVSVSGLGLTGMKYTLEIYNFDQNGRSGKTCKIQLKEFPFLHDFAVTENYAVILVNSVTFGMMGAAMGFKPLSDSLEYHESKNIAGYLVDLRSMRVVKRFEMAPGLIIHFCNAFERGDEIITDFMYTTDISDLGGLKDIFQLKAIKGVPLLRCIINKKTAKFKTEIIDSAPAGEFPVWDTRKTCYETKYAFYVAPIDNGTNQFFNSVVKLEPATGDFQCHDYGRNRYTSEAVFAPKVSSTGEEGDGYLLSFVYDAAKLKTDVVIVDAMNLDNEVACIELKHHVPYSFHGHFTPELFLT